MADKQEHSVDRWYQPVPREKVEAEQRRRKKAMTWFYGLCALGILIVVGALAVSAGKRKAQEAKRYGSGGMPEFTKTAPQKATAAPAAAPAAELPEDPEAIRALLSNPTNPVVKISTSMGDMLVELYEDKVPNTVANMVSLADSGYYKGMSFHRIIPDFMAQGGCPYSKKSGGGQPGTGGPGYEFADEFHPTLKHTGRGILSMANAGPGTNGSQFFLCFTATPHLDGRHSVFGKVVAGEQVLDALESIGTPSGSTKETVRFNIEVVLKQDHPYEVKKL